MSFTPCGGSLPAGARAVVICLTVHRVTRGASDQPGAGTMLCAKRKTFFGS